jgi:hypothetical protein
VAKQTDVVMQDAEAFARSLVAHWEVIQVLQDEGCAFMARIADLLLALADLTEEQFIERAWMCEAGRHD